VGGKAISPMPIARCNPRGSRDCVDVHVREAPAKALDKAPAVDGGTAEMQARSRRTQPSRSGEEGRELRDRVEAARHIHAHDAQPEWRGRISTSSRSDTNWLQMVARP